MTIAVRRADLELDRELIIDALARFLTPDSTVARYEWLYRSGPYGEPRAWIAVDTRSDAIIGVAAAFPRRLRHGRGTLTAWVLGDFCLDPRYRSLGPALQLQRACLNAAAEEKVDVCYDFPSVGMLAVYRRLGITTTHRVVRMARPLLVDRKLRELTGWEGAAKLIGPIGNRLLSLCYPRPRHEDRLSVELLAGEFGEEFSALDNRVSARVGVRVVRSAAYLNWRYLHDPLCRYDIVTVRHHGELLGCGVFRQRNEDSTLVDLFGIEKEEVLRAIIRWGTGTLTARNVQTLSAALTESHPLAGLLRSQGFVPREQSPVVIYTPRHCSRVDAEPLGAMWCLMHGDRDS